MSDAKALAALMEQVAALKAQNEQLAKQVASKSAPRTLTVKMGLKKNVCVYGLSKQYPITLYANQWVKLLAPAFVAEVLAFIEAHRDELTWERDPNAPVTPRQTAEQVASQATSDTPKTIAEQVAEFLASQTAKATS
jgi:hypothetical protein